MKRLGVNIDHVATLRNARGEFHPDPFYAANFVKKAGADSITIHLREDKRHIKDADAKKICSDQKILVNLEISTNSKIVKTALKIRPNFICMITILCTCSKFRNMNRFIKYRANIYLWHDLKHQLSKSAFRNCV